MPTEAITENIHFEGKDSVGKGDAAKTAVAALLFSKELVYNGQHFPPEKVCVIQTDFPQYWGLGALIRSMNSKVGRDYFKDKGYGPDEILHLRKAMYAMDRLVTLLLLNSIKKDPDKLYIHVSDRGPFSQAITHAVCFTDEDEYLTSLDDILDSDMCYMQRVKPNSVLLEASQSGLQGAGSRNELDELEKPLYQKLAERGFDRLKVEAGNRITPVVTRVGNDWRDRSEIAAEVLQTISVECQGLPPFEELEPKDFAKARQEGRLVQIGASEFVSYLYPNLTEDTYKHLRTIQDFDRWRKVYYFSNEKELPSIIAMSKSSRKEIIVAQEEVNSKKISYLLRDQAIPKHRIPADIEEFGRFLIGEYSSGELLDLVNYLEAPRKGTWSDEKGESGYELLLRRLFVPEVEYW